MPVAVIALAAGSFAAGATAFAAATTIAGMVAAGATMVGAAMTMVGTVTGNAKLTKIGAIVGIAGGLGTMAVNAASSASSAAAAGAEAGTEAAAGTAAADAAAGAAADAVTTVPVAAPEAIEAVGDVAADAAGKAATSGGGMLDAATSNTAANAVSGSTNDLLSKSLQDTTSTFNASTTSAGQGASNAFDAANTTVGQSATMDAFKAPDLLHPSQSGGGMLGSIESAGGSTASGGLLSNVQGWAKANPELAKMALNGVGSAFTNLVPSAKDKAMMEAYRAQAAATAQQTADAKRKAMWGSGRTV